MSIKDIPVFDLIIILGAIQGLLFACFLWFKPLRNRKAGFFLSLFILGFALNSVYHTLESIGLRGYLTVWDFSPFYCSHLIIVAFYFFIHFLVYPNRSFSKKDSLFFLPFLFQLAVQLWGLFWSFENRGVLVQNQNTLFQIYDFIDLLAVLIAIVVLIASIWKMKNYERSLQNNYAEIQDFSLKWLYQLIFVLFGVWLLFTIPTLYEIITNHRLLNIYYPVWICTSIMIYWIGYSTYFKSVKLSPVFFHEAGKNVAVKLSDKTQSYHEQLVSIMQQEKFYLNQDLNLQTLADKMELSSGYLSQIINQYEQKNFFDFVNGYRVEAVKEKIHNPDYQHLNLLGIALESGFKSKSTFNLAFKKLTGQTPSAFKKKGNK